MRPMVPLEALTASERAREALEAESAKLHAELVQQRLRHSGVRFAFVDYFSRLRTESLLARSFAAWRAEAKHAVVRPWHGRTLAMGSSRKVCPALPQT